ncbi:DUF4870 domain-containing protein [Lihuaxuella thermophila]|uniref:DUF4870 domain-containing protein n=1 Tax=Lihuaxuella thermophila TaxID=1173111 RepID=A0A1H8ARD8_9BACL|nr:DUF4870 domain-containing protein [Lihuaxuella thermophila]SEM72388.1 hypothetical protein SAMN05444955_101269 [Lihuaxuella thermophila]
MVTTEEKWLGVICHVSALFFPILGPLMILLLRRDSPFVREHAREALIFQLVMYIAIYLASWTMFILIGFLLVPVLVVFAFIVTVIAVIRAIEGKNYHYPFTSRWAQKI